jgi:hypothetical protein
MVGEIQKLNPQSVAVAVVAAFAVAVVAAFAVAVASGVGPGFSLDIQDHHRTGL